MSHKLLLDRRTLLKNMGFGLTSMAASRPLQSLIGAMAYSVINQARAQEMGVPYRKYIFLQRPGAPPRWMYDLFLTPYNTNNFTANPMVGTRYKASNGRYTDIEYATVNINGVNAPWMWQFEVPKVGGGTRPMADLMQNMMIMQGIRLNNDAHESAQKMHFHPLGAKVSIGGLVADVGRSYIPAIQGDTESFTFKSAKNLAPVTVQSWENMISRVLGTFQNKAPASFNNKKAQVTASLDAAVDALNMYAQTEHPGAETVSRTLSSARELFQFGSVNLTTEWNNLTSKYQDLIYRSLQSTGLAGINDMPIGTTGTRGGAYQYNENIIVNNTDMRTMITTMTNSVGDMAQMFAMAEFSMLNGLTDFLALRSGGIWPLSINNKDEYHGEDEHETGYMTSLMPNVLNFMAFSSCLLELFDRYKAAGIFNDVVIDTSSEFNRSPRVEGSGSDHGGNATSMTIYSGAINGPHVIGNTTPTGGTDYAGSWGEGGTISTLGEPLNVGHVGSTLAAMLKQPSPITAVQSVVVEQNGVLVPIIEKSKQV